MSSESEPRTVRVYLVGTAKIQTEGGVIEPTAEMSFATALYLALEPHRVSRRTLQTLLWPESESDVAAHRLRQTLLKLRRIGLPVQSAGKALIYLNSKVVIDSQVLEALGGADPCIERIGMPILAGFNPIFSAPYQLWLDSKTGQIAAGLSRVLLSLIAGARVAGKWGDVEKHAVDLRTHAPFNEEATLALAESLAMRGDKIQSLKLLDDYLEDVGTGASDLRVSPSTMRRRITDRMPRRPHDLSASAPLIGRESHLRALDGLLSQAKAGHPKACILLGDPGIGKTRLLTEFLGFASLQGAGWHCVSCRSSDAARPLALLLELIPSLRSMRGAIGSSPSTLEFFDTLTTHRPTKNAGPASVKSGLTSARLDMCMADILGAVTEDSTLIIAVEDYQWIDQASASALNGLVERLSSQRLLLILTSRAMPDLSPPTLPEQVVEIRIPALDDSASAEMMHSMVRQRGREVSDNYLSWCTRVAEGNPYFLHELANHWLETGEEHPAPPLLTTVLRQRLSRLSPLTLQLIQTCALLENHSTLDNLEEVLGFEPHDLLSSINDLAAAGMVLFASPDPASKAPGLLKSRHDLLSETALGLLAPPARAYLHRRAAVVLERKINEHPEASTLWSCAKHWHLAGDLPKAFRLAMSCATHLLDAGLPGDAATAFEKALEYCGSDSDRLGLLELQITAYYHSSDWDRVHSTALMERKLRTQILPEANQHDDIELMLLRAKWQTLNWNDILAQSTECLRTTTAEARHRVDAGTMALMILTFCGDATAGKRVFDVLGQLSRAPGVSPAASLHASMIYHTNWGSLTEATTAAHQLVALQTNGRDVGALFRSLCNASVSFRAAGLIQEATAHLEAALDLADRHNLHLSKSRAIPMLANMFLEQGNTFEAKKWLSVLQSGPIAESDNLGRAEISAIGARIALLEGRSDEARHIVDVELKHMRADQVPHRRTYAAALRVAAELATDHRCSRVALSNLESNYLLSRGNVFQAFSTFALHEGLLSVGDRTKAETILNEYVTHHRRECGPLPTHLLESLHRLWKTARESAGEPPEIKGRRD